MFTRFATTHASFGARQGVVSLRDRVGQLKRAHAVHVSRRELAELDPRLLRDIGMTVGQAIEESRRSAWDIEPPAPRRRGPGRASWMETRLGAVVSALRIAARRWRTRRSIAGLDNHTLRDIGVSFAEAENEANKPFWRR